MAAEVATVVEAFSPMAKLTMQAVSGTTSAMEFPDAADARITKDHIPKAELVPCLRNNLFQWPAFLGPSSEVITEVRDWADASILIPHEMIRWYHDQIRRVLENFKPHEVGNEWMTDAFFDWLEKYFIPNIHHHHDAEEQIYNPAIQAATEAKGLTWQGAFITPQHGDLLKTLEGFAPFREKIKRGDSGAVEEFKKYMQDYIATMNDHLKQEEQFFPEALRASMTEEDETKVVSTILSSLSLNDLKGMLPAILYAMCKWGGVDVVSQFLNNMPSAVKILLKHWFESDFYYNQYAVLHGLIDGVKPVSKSGGCCRCFK